MLRNRGIAFKLILFFTLSSGLILLLIFGFNYHFSRVLFEKRMAEDARNLVQAKVNRIESSLLAVQKVPDTLASLLENSPYRREELLPLLRALVKNNPDIYGAAIAFEPSGVDGKSPPFAPYFFKQQGELKYADLGKASYRYDHWDWYQLPKEINHPAWSEPYYDDGGGDILMATYSVPFYRMSGSNRQFAGIVTADINLDWLQEVVSSIKVLETGYGFLISKNGTFLTHPLRELIMNETLFGIAEARNDARLREIGRKMIRGESGFVPFRSIVSQEPCWMYYMPVPANGWTLAVLFPQNEFTADIARLSRMIIILGIAGLLLLSIAVAFIARSITNPLAAMAQASKAIATGNLDVELPACASNDEVGKLAEAFRYMKESLKEYITQLTETTASKERIESELKIAHDIQVSILPKIFPPFPDRPEFDIYAVIEPAREVGGDFYDFFFIDDKNFCFVIGDVSGKGVPAALFMAVTKTLIKATAQRGIDPGEILTNVNRELSQGNDSCMFATIFCGMLNTETGALSFANGGHNSPLIVRRDKEPEFLAGTGGLVVGAMEDAAYATQTVPLEPDESLFLYTDGVTEAMDARGEFYSDERLNQQVAQHRGNPIRQIIEGIMENIASFSRGALQSDDITIMMIQFKKNEERTGSGITDVRA